MKRRYLGPIIFIIFVLAAFFLFHKRPPEKEEIRPVKNAVLVLDIDGDGINTGPGNNHVYFDFGQDGFEEKTAWTGADVFLIRFADEFPYFSFFGDQTILSDGKKAGNGLLALMDLDTDRNGVLNEKDAAFDEIKLWQDKDENANMGFADAVKTLREAGIKSIRFEWSNQEKKDLYGSTYYRAGVAETDKGTRDLFLVRFKADYMDTHDLTEVEIPADIAALPTFKGMGNLHDLHTALALAKDDRLKNLLKQYMAETNPVLREDILTNLLYAWAGVLDVDPESRASTPEGGGNAIGDARKLETLEAFWGDGYLGIGPDGNRDPNPHFAAAPLLLETFERLKHDVDTVLLSQTHYKPLLDATRYKFNEERKRIDVDIEIILPLLEKEFYKQKEHGRLYLSLFARVLRTVPETTAARWNPEFKTDGMAFIAALRNAGNIHGSDFEAALATFEYSPKIGTSANDELTGTDVTDVDEVIYGLGGDDILNGEKGNDTLNGGSGNDLLIGGNGKDLYIFSAGFGQDTIDNTHTDKATDEILFGTGLSSEDADLSREEKDLIIRFGASDSVRISEFFDDNGRPATSIEKIRFSDEPEIVWTPEKISVILSAKETGTKTE